MNEMDRDGLIMCRMQGRIFEYSLDEDVSSAVFIRRFMNSSAAWRMDELYFLNTAQSELQVIDEMKEECRNWGYGSQKFDREEMYWIGYIYRYWAYIWNLRSDQIYRICNGTEMKKHYYIFHSLAPEKAIEMLMEEKKYVPAFTIEEKKMKSQKIIYEKMGI